MKILESFLLGKKPDPDVCEDGLVLGGRLIAVVDGVTAKGTRLWNGRTSGCRARELLCGYLQTGVEKQPPEELFQNLDALLHREICAQGGRLAAGEYPRASVIVYNDVYREVWSYGDCQCRINDEVFSHSKAIDRLTADLRAFYLERALAQGAQEADLAREDPGRAAILPLLSMQFDFENQPGPFGYPVLNGQGVALSMLRRYPVSAGDEIVLASDGYPVLERTLRACEAELERIRKADPLCFRLFRSTKGFCPGNNSFDDRTFCRFVV